MWAAFRTICSFTGIWLITGALSVSFELVKWDSSNFACPFKWFVSLNCVFCVCVHMCVCMHVMLMEARWGRCVTRNRSYRQLWATWFHVGNGILFTLQEQGFINFSAFVNSIILLIPQPAVYYRIYGAASSCRIDPVTYSLAGWVWFLWSFVHVHALTGFDGFPLHKIVSPTDRDILTSFPTRTPLYHWDCLKLTKMAPFQLGVFMMVAGIGI